MIELILLTMVLIGLQLMLPSIIAFAGGQVSTAYLLSARDESPETSHVAQRASRAANNLLETAPVFLTLAILAVHKNEDVLMFARAWLALRVLYLGLYITGTAYLRSLIWMAALVCLIGMGLALL